jgi:uracil-DNA glycosylase
VPALVASYHPSQQNTNTGKLTPPMLASVFAKAKKIATG